MIILGIETSCDETGIALYEKQRGLLTHELYSQVEHHQEFGGVIPELASRDHVRKILPLTKEALAKVGLSFSDLGAIAYTAGPGLIGSLMVGAAFACSLALSLKIPTIPVNHLEAHLLSPFLEEQFPDFPFLALLVSGGHTQLVEARSLSNYKLLGRTLDDALGEAFDKVAKILGLPYPGGPKLAELASKGKADRFFFPRPMKFHSGLDFSFSGLKTFALNCYKANENGPEIRENIAAAFQEAAIDSVIIKCRNAMDSNHYNAMVVAGGVSANLELRRRLDALGIEYGVKVYYPRLNFCTDNGAMVAYTGWRYFEIGKIALDREIKMYPRWNLN